METRRYPVDTQTFSTIVEGDYVYVDKTDLVYKMTHDYRYVFLARPRRFGKSLLCSTLDEYFNGNRDLFKGLRIDALEKEWVKYPVINLSFADAKDVSVDSINEIIDSMLDEHEKKFDIPRQGKDCGVRFKHLITNVSQKTGLKVVVIIDEYDAAMLDTINNDELQERIRARQNKFFSPLKDLGKYIRFVFITGITKFSQMSIFSTLNNLKDISLLPDFQTICGISKDEFLSQMRDGMQDFADTNGYTFDETVRYFKAKYDGYHFSPEMLDVYNPYSVINALNDKQLNDYWFNSGTPSSLLKLISKFDIKMEDFEGVECSASRFNQPVEKVTDLVPFLFQSGYLTIKNYKSVIYGSTPTSVYELGYPNDEVRSALADSLFKSFYKVNDTMPLRNAYFDFYVNDDLDKFIKALQKFFRMYPFALNNMNEKHCHSILYTVLTSFGADIRANQETALGKSDLILKMPKTIYVIELKYDRSTDSALDQIDDRDYVSAVLDTNKRIVKLAIKFSSKDRNIECYEAVEENCCDCGRIGKQELRRQIRTAKRQHSSAQLAAFSEKLCDNILSMPAYQQAHTLLLYCPLQDEVDVFTIIKIAYETCKTVLLPRVVGDDLELHIYKGVESLERGAYGILEPTGEVFADYDAIDLAIIPGMAFDRLGNRLGRGKGYYDRLLPRLKNAYKIGVCFPFQYFDEIPSEAHDVRMDCVMWR